MGEGVVCKLEMCSYSIKTSEKEEEKGGGRETKNDDYGVFESNKSIPIPLSEGPFISQFEYLRIFYKKYQCELL